MGSGRGENPSVESAEASQAGQENDRVGVCAGGVVIDWIVWPVFETQAIGLLEVSYYWFVRRLKFSV